MSTAAVAEESSANEQKQTSSNDTKNQEQQQPSETFSNNESHSNPIDDNQIAVTAKDTPTSQMEEIAPTSVSEASKTISIPPEEPTTAITPTEASKTATDQTLLHPSTVAKITLPQKITVTLKAVGDAPILKQKNWSIETSRTMAYVTHFLRQILKLDTGQSLFVFVNQCFAPSAEHTIGTLTQCFGNAEAGKLVLHYSTTQAWG